MRGERNFLLLAVCVSAFGLVSGCFQSNPMHTGTGGKSGGTGGDAGVDAPDGKGLPDAPIDTMPTMTCPDPGTEARASGESCTCDTHCASGFCVDGVCCDTKCDATCMRCDLASSPGICSAVPSGLEPSNSAECPKDEPSSCGRDGKCDGNGACRLYTSGVDCKPGTCTNGSVSGGYVCDGNGACKLGPIQACFPFGCADGKCLDKCSSDSDCAAGRQCQGNSCGAQPPGTPCKTAAQCDSGFCADGFCCNVACDGACVTCGAAGFEGQCRPVESGLPHAKCATKDKTTCGTTGVCDGFGSCAVFVQGVTCVQPSCTGNVLNTPGSCDGKGSCIQPAQLDCDPFVCRSGACATKCTSDLDCAPNRFCMNGSCGKRPIGSVCTTADQCDSNFCVDGYCCENGCDGACRSCGTAGGMPGRCRSVGAGSDDPHKQCKDNGKTSCGTNGKCDGYGACQKYPVGTECSSKSCSSGNFTPASLCDASGKCVPQTGWKCSPFTCNGSDCATVCQNDSLCDTANNNFCVNGSCGLKPPGSPCTAASQCQNAPDGKQYCSQGYCCNGACTGGCQSCALSTSRGSCTNIPSGGTPQNTTTCPTSSNMCGNTGKCNGSGGCQVPANGATCNDGNACTRTDTCQNGNCTGSNPVTCVATDQCHNAGTCSTSTGACSNPNKTDGTGCNDNNSCTSGETCQAGTCKGGTTKTCSASDQCHNAGTCDPATGSCSNPNKTDGTGCNDSNSCTSGETCQAGTCKGGTTKTCSASDQCHNAGTCDPATGNCSNPNKADGTGCNDSNSCTSGDTCQGGTCKGATKLCSASDMCHVAGICDPATGNCSNPAAPACVASDKCHTATCDGTKGCVETAKPCSPRNACYTASCDTGTGDCVETAKPCSPMNACYTASCDTGTGACNQMAKTCDTAGVCQTGGGCDLATGCQEVKAAEDGTACDGGTCLAGACVPS